MMLFPLVLLAAVPQLVAAVASQLVAAVASRWEEELAEAS